MSIGIHVDPLVPPESTPNQCNPSVTNDAQLPTWICRLDEAKYTVPVHPNSFQDMIKLQVDGGANRSVTNNKELLTTF